MGLSCGNPVVTATIKEVGSMFKSCITTLYDLDRERQSLIWDQEGVLTSSLLRAK